MRACGSCADVGLCMLLLRLLPQLSQWSVGQDAAATAAGLDMARAAVYHFVAVQPSPCIADHDSPQLDLYTLCTAVVRSQYGCG
eukprot:COSAG01_NODE_348_length_18498_cov_181.563128_18_plen_84_part_00